MSGAEDALGHWREIARRWEHVGPPLRPGPEDCAFYQTAIDRWTHGRGAAPRGLVLGTTQELCRLAWPAPGGVIAADLSPEMIHALWPGPRGSAVCADWTSLPFRAGSCGLALCDGGLAVLAHPDAQRRLLCALRRVLAPGGIFVTRLYVRPAVAETPSAVLHDLLAGAIPSLSALKLRLATAMQPTPEEGVELAAIWRAIYEAEPDFARLAEQAGWPLEHLLAINTYKDCPGRYYFVTLDELESLLLSPGAGFALEEVFTPRHPLGGRCPIVVLRRKDL